MSVDDAQKYLAEQDKFYTADPEPSSASSRRRSSGPCCEHGARPGRAFMTRADIVGGLLLAAFFGAALWEGWSFQYGTEFAPGPGFAPVWLSGLGLVISAAVAFAGCGAGGLMKRAGGGGESADAEKGRSVACRRDPDRAGRDGRLVSWIGFVPAILVFLLVLTLAVQRMSLRRRRHQRGNGLFRLHRLRSLPRRTDPRRARWESERLREICQWNSVT